MMLPVTIKGERFLPRYRVDAQLRGWGDHASPRPRSGRW
jgi:hypothetical protein